MTSDDNFGLGEGQVRFRQPDPREREAAATFRDFFDAHRDEVFFSRQLEVRHEDKYFHWISNRAIRDLREEGLIVGETRPLSTGGAINLLWHRGYRFHRRSARRLVTLVEEYANPNIGGVVGLHGEMMVLEGFARCEFVMRGRNTRGFRGRLWNETEHNLDFIFERDKQAYGVEVKNTLGYMDYEEFQVKIRLCQFLGIRPIFAARMLPKSWMTELIGAGGYGMIMKYQLYPWTHKVLAKRVAEELTLPVDAPRALHEVTMNRFLEWHKKLA
jgi:hypothetical protein